MVWLLLHAGETENPIKKKSLHQTIEGRNLTKTKHIARRTQQTESMYSLHMETMT